MLENDVRKLHTKFHGLGLIVEEKSWSKLMSGERRNKKQERKKKETVLEAKIAVFDKSSNPNGFEFLHAVFCIVLRRSGSVGRCYKTAAGVIGRRLALGTKIGNYRVDYNSTRSAAPKSGGGAVPAVAVAGLTLARIRHGVTK